MPFTGITYKVKPGNAAGIARIFSPENFTRVDSPFLLDETGEEIGCLVCTGLFLRGDRVVRVIQHVGGTVDDIKRHMSTQQGVHEAEEQLAPFLVEPRDTRSPSKFVQHFDDSLMTVVDTDGPDDDPAPALLACMYRISATPVSWLRVSYQQHLPPRLPVDGPISNAVVLAASTCVVKVFQFRPADRTAAAEFLVSHPDHLVSQEWLAPFATLTPPAESDPRGHLTEYAAQCVSHLSAATTGP